MTFKTTIVLILFTLLVTACGANPIEKLEEEAAEQITETIIEQATGAENFDFEVDDDSASYSVTDEEGNTISIASQDEATVEALTGLGFTIPLPAGLTDGAVQRIEENGEEAMITATFQLGEVTQETLVEQLHQALTAEGFSYVDNTNSGLTEPDLSNPVSAAFVTYTHPSGTQFTALLGDGGVILGLTKGDEAAVSEGVAETADLSITPGQPYAAAGFAESVAIPQTSFAASEAIEVTLMLSEPLADDAWVGVIPAGVPHGLEADADAEDVSYAYVRDAVDGKVTVFAPASLGHYDIRLFNTDAPDGVELASIPFEVSE